MRAIKVKTINQKKLPGIFTIVTSGLLLFMIRKPLKKNGINWRPGRLAAFLLMGEQESFTIAACRVFFPYTSAGYFPKAVRDMEVDGYVTKVGRVYSGSRPRTLYSLTHKGRQLHTKIYKTMKKFSDEHYKGYKTKSRII